MKKCPECSSEYGDDVNFCARDGRVLLNPGAEANRVCPYCANAVPTDARQCGFCRAALSPRTSYGWPKEDSTTLASDIKRMPNSSKWLWAGGMLLAALAGFFAGGYLLRRDLIQSMQDQFSDVEVKDREIAKLTAQLTQLRQEALESNKRLLELNNKIATNEKELSAAQTKIATAGRDSERLTGNKNVSRADTAAPPSDPSAGVSSRSGGRSGAAPKGGRGVDPGSYETVRYTTVHEEPVNSSRVVSQIEKGTRIMVVRGSGEWLEVRSTQGNPPGFIRRDDVILISRAN